MIRVWLKQDCRGLAQSLCVVRQSAVAPSRRSTSSPRLTGLNREDYVFHAGLWVDWVLASVSWPSLQAAGGFRPAPHMYSLHGSGATQHFLMADPQSTETKLNF